MRKHQLFSYFGILTAGLVLSIGSASADPLHGYCAGVGQCIDNGMNSPTSTNPPSDFGFTASPGPATGDLFLDILVPNNEDSSPSSLSFGITGTGISGTGTASLVSTTAWTSGDLDTYLGISASPANPIGAFVPDPADAGATGFFVYQFDAGTQTLQNASNPNVSPLFNLTSGVATGTYIVGFLNTGNATAPDFAATANSGAILEMGTVPEPSSLLWLFPAAAGIASASWRRHRA